MDPVVVVLNTRHGSLPSNGDFSTARWMLQDPIILPNDNRYALHVSVTFVSIPGDHKRINDSRGTTGLVLESRQVATGQTTRHAVYVPPGSYTRQGYIRAMNMACEGAGLGVTFSLKQHDDPDFALQTDEVVMQSTVPDQVEYRVLVDSEHNGSEVLGFHTDSRYASAVPVVSEASMDTQGTRTITIQGRGISTSATDPVEMTRRRSVLTVIPAPTGEIHHSWLWERKVDNPSVISSRYLDVIEMSLVDDMGKPINPLHHWSIGLEFTVRQRKHFVSNV